MKDDIWIKADGTTSVVSPKDGKEYKLDELQEFVGGYIELVFSPDDSRVMVLNEEGKLMCLGYNEKATEIYNDWARQKGYSGTGNFVVGDVLVTSSDKID